MPLKYTKMTTFYLLWFDNFWLTPLGNSETLWLKTTCSFNEKLILQLNNIAVCHMDCISAFEYFAVDKTSFAVFQKLPFHNKLE